MIFDVKLGENFHRKACFVAGGNMTNPPATLTYSSVVSRDSVRIALMLATLNQMSILTADIDIDSSINLFFSTLCTIHSASVELIWYLINDQVYIFIA
jgi:hypothetical protein